MPELLITAGFDRQPIHSICDLDEWSHVTLYGRMLFPNDDDKFEEYCEAATGRAARDEFKKLFVEAAKSELKKQLPNLEGVSSWSAYDWIAANREKLPYPEDLESYRIYGSHFAHLETQGRPYRAGERAGEVLFTLKRIFDNPEKVLGRKPSLDQAFAVTAAMNGLKPRIMRLAWQRFRLVSHLWAAFLLFFPFTKGPFPFI